jgi:CRISPR-associated protein Csm5
MLRVGGGIGFVSKTAMYSLFGRQEGIASVSKILHYLFNEHFHNNNKDSSPRYVKTALYDDKYMEMGLCDISIERQ